MKKLIYITTTLFLSLNFSSCEKETEKNISTTSEGIELNEVEPLKSFSGVSIVNEMIKFETLEDYYAVFDHPNPVTRVNFSTFISEFNFKNYFSNGFIEPIQEGVQEMDEFFGQVINQNSCIQIADHVYKIDLAKENVFVISSDLFSVNSNDLINGNFETNENIKVYALTDDVISIVNGIPATKSNCDNPTNFEQYTVYNLGGLNETRCYIKYFTAGIYYRVTGRSKKIGGGYGGSVEYRFILECMNATTEIRRNPCNNSEVTSHAVGVKRNTLNEPEPVWEMYSKSWKIKESIYIAIRTRVEVYGDITTLYFNTPTNIYTF